MHMDRPKHSIICLAIAIEPLACRQRVTAIVADACKLSGFGRPPALILSCFGLQQMPEPQEVHDTIFGSRRIQEHMLSLQLPSQPLSCWKRKFWADHDQVAGRAAVTPGPFSPPRLDTA